MVGFEFIILKRVKNLKKDLRADNLVDMLVFFSPFE